jgi:hypothetical protein
MSNVTTGGCQCGEVRYRITGSPLLLVACHCKECQRQAGSAFGMSLSVRRADFELTSGTLRSFTRGTDSGREIRCSFCPSCGTRIHHEPQYAPGALNLKAGTLDDTTSLSPTMHVWTCSKQSWVTIPDDVDAFEQQPV